MRPLVAVVVATFRGREQIHPNRVVAVGGVEGRCGAGGFAKAGTVTPVPGTSRRPALAVALAVALAAGAAWLPTTGHAQHTKLSLESIGPDGGNGAQSAELVGALAVGKRSFIRTAEPLVSSDTDSSLDVY